MVDMVNENGIGEEQLNNIENVDDRVLAESISEQINLKFQRSILVKQLDIKKVKRIVKEPVKTEEKDEDGNDVYEHVDSEVEVDSIYREGIILKLPSSITNLTDEARITANLDYAIGDRVIYRNMRASDFDYIPNAALIDAFDIICRA